MSMWVMVSSTEIELKPRKAAGEHAYEQIQYGNIIGFSVIMGGFIGTDNGEVETAFRSTPSFGKRVSQ